MLLSNGVFGVRNWLVANGHLPRQAQDKHRRGKLD
eukprot:COSAG06_NODE_62116_length_266_cov_0.514970_1_plen_34_part_01